MWVPTLWMAVVLCPFSRTIGTLVVGGVYYTVASVAAMVIVGVLASVGSVCIFLLMFIPAGPVIFCARVRCA
eukprot:gene17144-10295_t